VLLNETERHRRIEIAQETTDTSVFNCKKNAAKVSKTKYRGLQSIYFNGE